MMIFAPQIWYVGRDCHTRPLGPTITLLVKFNKGVISKKFGTMTQNDIPVMIRRSKSEVEFQHGGYRTDMAMEQTPGSREGIY